MSATIVPTDPGAILLALQLALQTSAIMGLDPKRVQIGIDREPWPYIGNTLYFMPGSQKPDHEVIEGTGRRAHLYRGDFTARYIGRNVRDFPGFDSYGLTNPFIGTNADGGLEPMARAVLNVLNSRFLIDGSGNFLSVEPMKAAPIGIPGYFGKDLAWAGIDSRFQVAYMMKLDVASDE